LDEVPNEPWMVDILKLLIDRISPTYKRQVIVRLASSNPQEVDESVQESGKIVWNMFFDEQL